MTPPRAKQIVKIMVTREQRAHPYDKRLGPAELAALMMVVRLWDPPEEDPAGDDPDWRL